MPSQERASARPAARGACLSECAGTSATKKPVHVRRSVGTFRPYELAAIPRRDAIFRHRAPPVENHRIKRKHHFRSALSHSMDCLGTRAQKRDPNWFLGMQRAWVDTPFGLFRDLPARFRRRFAEHFAASNLSTEPLFSLYPS
jgi:hypothetical protein